MTSEKLWRIKEDKTISVDADIAEWRKDPQYMRAYESLKPKYDRLRRQIRARKARREWRAAQLARVREVWHWLWRRVDRVVY